MALEYLMLEWKMGGKKEDIIKYFQCCVKMKELYQVNTVTVDRIDQTLCDQYLYLIFDLTNIYTLYPFKTEP